MSETPQNTSAKPVITAAAAKRANASIIGMILAMLATVAIVLTIVWLNPQQNANSYRQPANVAAIAGDAADVAGFTPAAPILPEGWSANYARWDGSVSDHVPFWDVGYVTAGNNFIALKQTKNANPTWLAQQAENAPVTGSRVIDGKTWELRDTGSGDRSLVLEIKGTTVILTGSADFKEFDVLAAATTKQLDAAPAATVPTKGAK